MSASMATPAPMRVWFARDQLPLVAAVLQAPGSIRDGPEARIDSRLSALWGAQDRSVPTGATDPFAKAGRAGSSGQLGSGIRIEGDLATVTFDLPAGWGISSSVEGNALIQQLVYTITEEPGIRRAFIKEARKPNAIIGPVVVDRPLTREDVFGYAFKGADVPSIDFQGGTQVPQELVAVQAWNEGAIISGSWDPSPGVGRVSLEVFWVSPKDGSDQDLVKIPLTLR